MALRPRSNPYQPDLFEQSRNEHATRIRQNGGESLAPALPPVGATIAGDRPAGGSAAGGAGENLGRDGVADARFQEAGFDSAPSARSGVGTGAREIPSPSARVDLPRVCEICPAAEIEP